MSMLYILSRTKDYEIHSRKWIVGYGLMFWLISRMVAILLIIGCVAIYNTYGINPEALTKFVGDPEIAKKLGYATYFFITVCFVAPLLEECIFRLGLSFRRWQIALAIASIPVYILWQQFNSLNALSISIYAVSVITIFSVVNGFTADSYWKKIRRFHYVSIIWLSAIAFGLIHLIAFSNHSLLLLTNMLCVVTVPFFAGCAMTYYRINLGFWWGVGLHIFDNIPAIMILISEIYDN